MLQTESKHQVVFKLEYRNQNKNRRISEKPSLRKGYWGCTNAVSVVLNMRIDDIVSFPEYTGKFTTFVNNLFRISKLKVL